MPHKDILETTSFVRGNVIVTDKSDIRRQSLVREYSGAPLQDGQVLVSLNTFGFTSNNISYAVGGDEFDYWKYFPFGSESDGIVPVWGYASISRSGHSDISEGEEIFGFFPMASQVVLQPSAIRDAYFFDGAEHRRALHPVYNQYFRTKHDPNHIESYRDLRTNIYPLFATSFAIDDMLDQNDFFGAERIVICGASSKTAIGLASLLAKRGEITTIALTSTKNRKFVQLSGLYDGVLDYHDATSLKVGPSTICVDFSGSGALIETIHATLGSSIVHSMRVGRSHWEKSVRVRRGLRGARPQLFMAFRHIAERQKEVGTSAYLERLKSSWVEFAQNSSQIYQTRYHCGEQSILELSQEIMDGKMDPSVVDVCSFRSSAP